MAHQSRGGGEGGVPALLLLLLLLLLHSYGDLGGALGRDLVTPRLTWLILSLTINLSLQTQGSSIKVYNNEVNLEKNMTIENILFVSVFF